MSIIIAGGGMAGATLALAISRLTNGQLSVTLIEARPPTDKHHPGYDSRAIALAAGTCQALEAVNLWDMLADCATPITRIRVNDTGHGGQVSLTANEYQVPALGYVVEQHRVGQRLYQQLTQAAGVTLCCPASVTNVVRTAESVAVTLNSGQTITGKLLVAADGTCSRLAATCGIRWVKEAYQQVAIIATVTPTQPHQGHAFESFTPSGPLALLPFSEQRCALVWCHALTDVEQVMNWGDKQFLGQLQQAFGWRLGQFIQVGTRESYPLSLQRAEKHISHRLALVGNAAQTMHPIAGQGFNLGLRDVMSLAETLADSWRQQRDPGSYAVLAHYQQRRIPDQQATITLTDGLLRLFSNRWWPAVVGRGLGLMAMNHSGVLRQLLAQRMLGWVQQ